MEKCIPRYDIFRPDEIEERPAGDWIRYADLPQNIKDLIQEYREKHLDWDAETKRP